MVGVNEQVPQATEGGPIGPLIGSIIIIIVIALGGIYFWAKQLHKEAQNKDDLQSIEADLKNTNIDHLKTKIIQTPVKK